MTRHAFIIGGTGQIGQATAHELIRDGWEVTISHRGNRPPSQDLIASGVRTIILDRNNLAELTKALHSGADAIIDTVAYDERHANQLLELQNDVGGFVVISSASVYSDEAGRSLDEAQEGGFPDFPEPIKETQATVAPGNETYSTRKVALENKLLQHSSKPVTILRPCAIHGVGSEHPREWWFIKRMIDKRKFIPLAYRGESRFHTSAVANIASLVNLALKNQSTKVLNVGDQTSITVAEIGEAIAKHLNYKGDLVPVDDHAYPPTIGSTPWSTPSPFRLDNSAAVALGYEPLAYDQSIGPMCDWLILTKEPEDWKKHFPILASYPIELFDYSAEDKFLAECL